MKQRGTCFFKVLKCNGTIPCAEVSSVQCFSRHVVDSTWHLETGDEEAIVALTSFFYGGRKHEQTSWRKGMDRGVLRALLCGRRQRLGGERAHVCERLRFPEETLQ